MSHDFLETKKCVQCGHSFNLLESIGVLNCNYHPKSTTYNSKLDMKIFDCCGEPYYNRRGCEKKSHSAINTGRGYHIILISDLKQYFHQLPKGIIKDFLIQEKIEEGSNVEYLKISIYPIKKCTPNEKTSLESNSEIMVEDGDENEVNIEEEEEEKMSKE
jgi:hypothetical protein